MTQRQIMDLKLPIIGQRVQIINKESNYFEARGKVIADRTNVLYLINIDGAAFPMMFNCAEFEILNEQE